MAFAVLIFSEGFGCAPLHFSIMPLNDDVFPSHVEHTTRKVACRSTSLLKGDEFNNEALSNAVADIFSHSTSTTITKMQKNRITTFDRPSLLNSVGFSSTSQLSSSAAIKVKK